MTGQAVRGADDPDAAAALLAAYLDRFPKAAKVLGNGTYPDRLAQAVLVRCRPR